MSESEHVSRLIGDIYDAALDPALWPSVLESTCQFVNAVAALVLSVNLVDRRGEFYFSWGDDPHYTELYFKEYGKINPLVPQVMQLPVGEVYCASTLMPYEQLKASRFFREWAEPQGYADFVATILEKSILSTATVSVSRDRRNGLADDETRRRMGLLAPHFLRAVAIGKVIDLHRVEAATFADTLDGLAAGMFLVDDAGRIIHSNASGQALLADGGMLRNANGILRALEPQANKALQDVCQAAGSGDTAVGISGIAVPLTGRDGERFVAHALPLTAGARRRTGVAYSAAAALFVHRAAPEAPGPFEVVAQHFSLTPTELRVLFALVEIGGVPESAKVLGIAETTVKTHLRRLFQKTGAKRQADLVKIVAGFASPLR